MKNIDTDASSNVVNLELILIRLWLGREYALWIAAHHLCDKVMGSPFGNGAGDSPENSGKFKSEVKEMVSRIGGYILTKARSNFSLVMGQLEGPRKDMEIVQATSQVIMTKIENLDRKVENLEENVEIVVVSVLKQAFDIEEGGDNEQARGDQGAPSPEIQQVVIQSDPMNVGQQEEVEAAEMEEARQRAPKEDIS